MAHWPDKIPMKPSKALLFTAPRQVAVMVEHLPKPQPGQVLVRSKFSAISAGTEMLIYRGQAPAALKADASIPSLAGSLAFPLKYGYACVGEVIEVGQHVSPDWIGRLVFSFQPHQQFFNASLDEIIPVPADISPENALFLPNMETAVNFVMDGHPVIGERAAVFGQGIVGLLTTALLSFFPLSQLLTFDHIALRRRVSLELGAHSSLDPNILEVPGLFDGLGQFDLAFEVSGAPLVLNQAIQMVGYGGRVVVGSWYGVKQAPIDLGGVFHRNRIRLLSSQVSTIAPEYSARWTKSRRFDTAWQMIGRLNPTRLITSRFPIDQAAEAYHLLDSSPGDHLQVIFEYQE